MLCAMPAVLVVGDVCVDVLARAGGAVRAGTDTPAQVRVLGGGAGGNLAAWLATLGVRVTLVARIGDDAAGRAQAAELSAYGVRCSFAVDAVAPTGTVVVLVAEDGERTMLTDRGANLRLSVADLPELTGARRPAAEPAARPAAAAEPAAAGPAAADLAAARSAAAGPAAAGPAADHLHLSGYTLLHEGPRAAGLAALARASAAGMTISVDPASVAPLAELGPETFLGWTRGADLLLPNLPEARLLSGRSDATAAATALAQDFGAVAVTMGADGVLWAAGNEVAHVPAPEARAVDSTGAGDAFDAGLLAAWLSGERGAAAARQGVHAATAAVTRLGARPPLPP